MRLMKPREDKYLYQKVETGMMKIDEGIGMPSSIF